MFWVDCNAALVAVYQAIVRVGITSHANGGGRQQHDKENHKKHRAFRNDADYHRKDDNDAHEDEGEPYRHPRHLSHKFFVFGPHFLWRGSAGIGYTAFQDAGDIEM